MPVEGRTRAVYAEATAAEVPEADRERCLGVFDRRSRAEGLGSWTTERVVAPASLRLYHASVSRLFILEPDVDLRREVDIGLWAQSDCRNELSLRDQPLDLGSCKTATCSAVRVIRSAGAEAPGLVPVEDDGRTERTFHPLQNRELCSFHKR